MELDLFWKHIAEKFETGLENWKQHYVAWMLVFITSVRPGSFTTCPGYEQGAFLADGKTQRTQDETLRWSDVDFFRVEGGGIGFKINFQYVKGARNPHTRKPIPGNRIFTILPLNSDDYHFDLALLMTALAYSRGLFANVDSPEQLFAGTLAKVPKIADIDRQAVFLASNQAQTLEDRPLHERKLTPKLQEMCNAVGLLQRNTMYSLRRTAITESRRKHGTEHAQDIAFHARGGTSIYSYDDTAFQDFDIANDRLDLDGLSRQELRQMFSQAATSRMTDLAQPLAEVGDASTSLPDKLNIESMRRAREDELNIENESNLRDLKSKANQLLLSLGIEEVFSSSDRDLFDHLIDKADSSADCKSRLDELRAVEKKNKTDLRRLQVKYKKEIKLELLEDIEQTQTVLDRKQKGSLGRQGTLSGPEMEARGRDDGSTSNATEERRRAIAALSTEVTAADQQLEEDEAAAALADQNADHGRTEPSQWENLPDEVEIQQNAGDATSSATLEGRIAFIKTFAAQKDVETAGLACMQCYYDDTIPYAKKEQKYTLSSLDKHLKGDYHSRKAQLLRAYEIDKDGSGNVDCPLCPDVKLNRRKFMPHFEEFHDDQLAF